MSHKHLKQQRIGVLYGGLSSEREVSLKTGTAILKALQESGYNVVGIDVDRNLASTLQQEKIELAFIALHGAYGEDGCIQGLLELLEIPYTGSSVRASALAMDKVLTKKILLQENIPTPKYREVDHAKPAPSSLGEMGLSSVVVKPSREGSSVGINVCHDDASLQEALATAKKYDSSVLIEQFVQGRELTVGVLDGKPMAVLEIVPAEKFYDYTAKYESNTTQYLCPAPVSEAVQQKAMEYARRTHEVIGCSGVTRVDLLLDEQEQLWVLEINTIPGMTATSLVPKMAAEVNFDFAGLCGAILETASLYTGQAGK